MSDIDRQAEKHKYSNLLNANYQLCLQQLQASNRKSFWARICGCNQDILEMIISNIEKHISKKFFLQAQGMIIAVQLYQSRQLKNTRRQPIYRKLIFKFSENLRNMFVHLEKIVCLQKMISVLEENQEMKNNQMSLLGQQLHSLADQYQKEDRYSLSKNPKIPQTYKKIWKLYNGKYDVSKWIAYESQQTYPNFQSIIQTVSENPSQAYSILVLIHQRRYKQAWDNLLQSKKHNSLQYSKFLTFIDLQTFSEINQLIKTKGIDPLATIIFKEAAHYQKNKKFEQAIQEKVKSHHKCIEFYQQNQLHESLTYAYRNLIKILTLNDDLQRDDVNAKNNRAQQILGYYQRLLYSKSSQKGYSPNQQKERAQYMSRIFSSVIQTTLQQVEPNYYNLLKIRERYFDNDLGDSLIYVCAGNFRQARLNAQYCNLKENADQSPLSIWRIADLMDKQKYTDVRQVTKDIDRSKESWIRTLLEKIEEISERSQKSFLNILND